MIWVRAVLMEEILRCLGDIFGRHLWGNLETLESTLEKVMR